MARRRKSPPASPPETKAIAPPAAGRRWRLGAGLCLLGLGMTLGGVGWWSSHRPPRDAADVRREFASRTPKPADINVVVVTIDTLRADRLGCYGYDGIRTPSIDAVARDGVLFLQATATVPLTFPSHSSLFTGMVPPKHGVRDNGGFFLEPPKTTLAERLKAEGFATGAFVGAWVLDSKWGLAQGFDHYGDRFDLSKYKTLSLGTVQKPGDEVMTDALAWMDTVKSRRFFSWIHLYDPHTPYDPPEPFASQYPNQPYLGEIAYTDGVVGRLTRWLDEQKLASNTLLIITADHGEALGQHGEATHAYFIYDATMHVPLIVRTPWGDKGRVATQASGVDLLPTVLDLLQMAPEPGIDGKSLARAILDPTAELGHVAYSETYFPRYHFGWQHLRALRNGKYKYIDAPEPELYDLAADPGETKNIFKAYSQRAEDLRLALVALGGTGAAAPERQQLDPETLQRLAALGYVGSAADVDPHAVLPDPKSKIKLFSLMNAAKAAGQEDRLDEAITKMRQVVTEDPGIIDAHLTLGNWLAKARRPDEAVAEFKTVLSMNPNHEIAIVNLAHIYRAKGDTRAALEGYRTALKLDPQSPQTWFQLATLHLDLGQTKEAEETFREAARANPKMGAAYNSLGAIAYAKGDGAGAESLVRKALELEPEVRTGHFNLARLLEARGQKDEAERLYRRELERYPDNGKARFNLAQLLRERGDPARALLELRASLERAPDFGPPYFFLAREALNGGQLAEARDLALRGLKVAPGNEVAPLGHYVLADVYNRQGQAEAAREEVAKAQKLETALRKHASPRI